MHSISALGYSRLFRYYTNWIAKLWFFINKYLSNTWQKFHFIQKLQNRAYYKKKFYLLVYVVKVRHFYLWQKIKRGWKKLFLLCFGFNRLAQRCVGAILTNILPDISCFDLSIYRKVASSRLVYYSIFDHFWGATNQDMLHLPCPAINQLMSTVWSIEIVPRGRPPSQNGGVGL